RAWNGTPATINRASHSAAARLTVTISLRRRRIRIRLARISSLHILVDHALGRAARALLGHLGSLDIGLDIYSTAPQQLAVQATDNLVDDIRLLVFQLTDQHRPADLHILRNALEKVPVLEDLASIAKPTNKRAGAPTEQDPEWSAEYAD